MAVDFDAEFSRYLVIAQGLISKIRDHADRQICSKWIQKLCNLQSDDTTVKKNRNLFFKYLIDKIELEATHGHHLRAAAKKARSEGDPDHPADKFLYHWSPDHKTYVACKPIPGRGAMIYMAVADDVRLGWDIPSLRKPKPSQPPK